MLKFGKRFVVLIAFLTMFVVVFATSGAYSYWAGTVESPAEETKEVIIQAGNWPKPQKPPKQWPPTIDAPFEPGDIIEYEGVLYIVREQMTDGSVIPGQHYNNFRTPYNELGSSTYDPHYGYRQYDIVIYNGIHYIANQDVNSSPGNSHNNYPGDPNKWSLLPGYSSNVAYTSGTGFRTGTGDTLVIYRVIQNAPAGTPVTDTNYFKVITQGVDYYWQP